MPRANGHTSHRGGLSPTKYLEPDVLAQVREFVRARAHTRKSKRAITDWLIVDILSRAGLRGQELCDLQLRDLPIDHTTPVIEVRQGKGQVSRIVDIPSTLVDHIREYAGEYRRDLFPTAPLIEARTGRAMCYRTLHTKLVGIGQEMGLSQRLKPHTMRHSYACWAYGKTKDILWISEQLGHADLQTTMIYAKTVSADRRANAETLA